MTHTQVFHCISEPCCIQTAFGARQCIVQLIKEAFGRLEFLAQSDQFVKFHRIPDVLCCLQTWICDVRRILFKLCQEMRAPDDPESEKVEKVWAFRDVLKFAKMSIINDSMPQRRCRFWCIWWISGVTEIMWRIEPAQKLPPKHGLIVDSWIFASEKTWMNLWVGSCDPICGPLVAMGSSRYVECLWPTSTLLQRRLRQYMEPLQQNVIKCYKML
jgi:hypothetical protein